MVINENNSHLNSFVKGMNSDTAYDQIPNQLYTFGKNIRITKNDLIGSNIDAENHPSLHEGVVTPVPAGKVVTDGENPSTTSFARSWVKGQYLGSDSIGNIGVIITKEENNTRLVVYRTEIDEKTDTATEPIIWWKGDISEKASEFGSVDAVSTVTYQELEGVIKLYIATGVYPIIEIRIDGNDEGGPFYSISNNLLNVDDFINNRILPKYPVYIEDQIDGALKTSQVQYTYRYYDKFGITTQLAPLTNKILVIDSNRSKETGNAQDTTTSVGFKLHIRHTNEYSRFKRLLIFRLSYIVPGENAHVELIYDGEVNMSGLVNTFEFNDVGTTPLQELTMEEFVAMSGLIVIPKIIEQNQQYLFAANVKDDTILQDVIIDDVTISQKLFEVTLSKNITGVPTQSTDSFDVSNPIRNYFSDRNINVTLPKDSYNNIFTSSLLRSLRRGETYEYGIVYYDKYGRRTNVLKLDSVDVNEYVNDCPFYIKDNLQDPDPNWLVAKPIGIKFDIPTPEYIDENQTRCTVENIIGCQIVRRSAKSIYQKTLLQVALARPIRLKTYQTTIDNIGYVREGGKDERHPVVAPDVTAKNSPYYPTGFLWSDRTRIWPGYQVYPINADSVEQDFNLILTQDETLADGTVWQHKGTDYFNAVSKENDELFLIFSSEIDFRRDDVLSKLNSNSGSLFPCCYVGLPLTDNNHFYSYQEYNALLSEYVYINSTEVPGASADSTYLTIPENLPEFITRSLDPDTIDVMRWKIKQNSSNKISEKCVFPLYRKTSGGGLTDAELKDTNNNYINGIKTIKDVKLPEWYDGFSNIELDGADLASGGIKKYLQFDTNIDKYLFNNWISFGLYDFRITPADAQPNVAGGGECAYASLFLPAVFQRTREVGVRRWNVDGTVTIAHVESRGWIGPGSSCFLMTINSELGSKLISSVGSNVNPKNNVGDTVICNIRHDVTSGVNEPEEFVQYFGFGNFFALEEVTENNTKRYKIAGRETNSSTDHEAIVFDGDIYITPQELTTMYKTYDFKSADTLLSMLITNYVPMESKVNTFFDYGMNYLNTNSANLLIEPGSIDGVTTQDRPVHQYNLIYSANDESNDVFTLVVEKSEDNNFKQRTYYSEPKTNGEYVDNFVIFKPAAYIDVDGKYGEVTNLLTDKNILYYWQDHAFGKFSVNERSLINDQNGNTIMLGQAGILSRNDYISTKYGMRLYDFCATGAENGVYWVDVNNRAVVAGNSNQALNYGELLNVQNIINAKMATYTPRVDYDLQNNELMCKCLSNDEQIIFNLKLNVATSVYNRNYEDVLNIKNHLYGITLGDNDLSFIKYNNLNTTGGFLTPLQLSFVVNAAASTTKTFDSQQLVPVKRILWSLLNDEDTTTYFENALATVAFKTDMNNVSGIALDNLDETHNTRMPLKNRYTDREGNIIYNIPRFGGTNWGNRLRGKWMKVDINANTPTEYTTISHVITKFRQSYS